MIGSSELLASGIAGSGVSVDGTEAARRFPERKALLVFADAVPLDLCRRKWPKNFQSLLRLLPLNSGWLEGVDLHFFSSLGLVCPSGCTTYLHGQRGASFGERLENAIEVLAGRGYGEIVIVGRDCPDLEISDIAQAFTHLGTHRLILGPDHRGGCYLIAFHANDRARLKQVRWQQNSDCNQLRERFGTEATFLLPVKYDLDSMDDVRLIAGSGSRWRQVAEELLRTLQPTFNAFRSIRVDSRLQRIKVDWQLPPPKTSSLSDLF